MNGLSPWAATVRKLFDGKPLTAVYTREMADYVVRVHHLNNALWIVVDCPKGARIVLRAAYAPDDMPQLGRVRVNDAGLRVELRAAFGDYEVRLEFPAGDKALFRYTTTLKTAAPLLVPFWPRDMVCSGEKGTVLVSQVGTRSGLQYMTLDQPRSGALLYFQNLTALNDYAEATETSLGNTVGGNWPELGFALPLTLKDKPVPAGREIVLSDAFLAFDPDYPKDDLAQAKQFLNLLSAVYLVLPKPATAYYAWPQMVDKGLHDLEFSHGCWSHGAGQDYLNAYVADYQTPPELMVQLAVLMP